ncbi:MAG: winged helix-turn-helix transcriptional regulator [Nitrososphaerales archaeon]|jgi:predicted transcriptional regulator
MLPGIHLRELQRLLDASFNTTRYHVYNLERDGEVVCAKEGGYFRLFPVGFDARSMGLYSVLHNGTTRQVLRALVDRGPLANGSISDATGLPRSTVSEHVEALCKTDLVDRSAVLGGGALYHVRDPTRVRDALAFFERNLLAVAADSFADLWGF